MKRLRNNWEPLEPNLPLETPWVINVDPSASCNFICKFCFQSTFHAPKGIMQWYTYRQIIDDISAFDKPIKTLRLYAFGEPLINKHFPDMVKYAKDKGISYDIDTTTNASLLTPHLNTKIIEAGMDRINISIIGVNKEQYKEFSSYDINFEKFVDNIAHLYHNRNKCIIFIKINGDVISKEDEQRFIDIFSPIADGVAVEHVMNCWYDFEMGQVQTNKSVGVYGQPLAKVKVCPYVQYSMCFHASGEASVCFLDWNKQMLLGNIAEARVKDIWNSQKFREFKIMMLRKQRANHPICKTCNQLEAGHPVDLDSKADDILRRMGED